MIIKTDQLHAAKDISMIYVPVVANQLDNASICVVDQCRQCLSKLHATERERVYYKS